MDFNSTIKRCLKGDRIAYEQLFREITPKISFVCKRYIHSSYDVNDVSQEVMIKIFRNLNSFNPQKGDFLGWVYRIAVNESLRTLQREAKFRVEDIEDNVENAGTVNLPDNITVEELMKLLDQLPDIQRTVFNLYFIEGYNHAEIAEQLEIKESSSRSCFSRAKQQLRDLYLKQEID